MVCQNDGNGYSKENSDIKKGPEIHRAAAFVFVLHMLLFVFLLPINDVED